MKFNQTLTRIAEAMISSAATTGVVAPPAKVLAPPAKAPAPKPTVASPVAPAPVDDTASIAELETRINNLPDTHPDKTSFLNQIKVLQQKQTDGLKEALAKIASRQAQAPKLEKTLTHFYNILGRAYEALNEAGPDDPAFAQPPGAPPDAAMPQPNAGQPDATQAPPTPPPTPAEVDKSGKTEELENDSNKIALVGIITRILTELLKHQNEVIVNSSSELSEKQSAKFRANELTKLIDTTTSENLATSKLNDLIKHIQKQFYVIYPTGQSNRDANNGKQTNKSELINIIIGILNELLKHQNEVVTNKAANMPDKSSAGRRSESLKRLIDYIAADSSDLNKLLQYIQSQFNQIYPVT